MTPRVMLQCPIIMTSNSASPGGLLADLPARVISFARPSTDEVRHSAVTVYICIKQTCQAPPRDFPSTTPEHISSLPIFVGGTSQPVPIGSQPPDDGQTLAERCLLMMVNAANAPSPCFLCRLEQLVLVHKADGAAASSLHRLNKASNSFGGEAEC